MGYIYQITNKINNKIYIGQTKNTIEERWQQHCYQANDGSIFHKAILKYGKTNFSIKILEECDNSLLNEREKFWIKEKNSIFISGKGYNMTEGGETISLTLCKKVRCISPSGDILDFDSVNSAGRELNKIYGNLFDGKIISKICNGIGNTHHKWHFYFVDDNNNIIYPKKQRAKTYTGRILAINLENNEQQILLLLLKHQKY